MYAGQEIRPNEGEVIRCLRSAADGGRFEYEVELAPKHDAPPAHAHDEPEEVEILAGSVWFFVDGEKHLLRAGDRLTIQPGQMHTFANASKTETLVGRGSGGRHFEQLVDQFAARDAGFLRLAVFLQSATGRKSYFVRPPVRAVLAVAAWIGRLRGIRVD